uniref:Uncharacterized protein n=1 Tax=Lactuca sativa TaxID=4236 RepID=A0A9R1W171_LACSA|nr:hypothetical protein LSAT_V11C400178810 [Lactuca sativa]
MLHKVTRNTSVHAASQSTNHSETRKLQKRHLRSTTFSGGASSSSSRISSSISTATSAEEPSVASNADEGPPTTVQSYLRLTPTTPTVVSCPTDAILRRKPIKDLQTNLVELRHRRRTKLRSSSSSDDLQQGTKKKTIAARHQKIAATTSSCKQRVPTRNNPSPIVTSYLTAQESSGADELRCWSLQTSSSSEETPIAGCLCRSIFGHLHYRS